MASGKKSRHGNEAIAAHLVKDAACTGFLQWALPRLGMRWPGFPGVATLAVLLLVCIGVFYAVSYATKAPDYARISGLTYGTVTSDQRSESRSSWGFPDVFWSGFVIVCILAAYLFFRG